MSSDGANTYKWDAENRLIEIDYPGSGNKSEFVYDGKGVNVKIVETQGGSVVSTKQFVCSFKNKMETRDASSAIVSQFMGQGEVLTAANMYYTNDFLGSIREFTDGTGQIQGQYVYDCYGRQTKVQGTLAPSFKFTRLYDHPASGLSLSLSRAYIPRFGRWLSRDRSAAIETTNLFSYVNNSPSILVDTGGNDGTRPVNENYTDPHMDINTTSPDSVLAIGSHGVPGNLSSDKNGKYPITDIILKKPPLNSQRPPCLIAISACSGADPASGSSNMSTSAAAQIAKKTGCFVVGCKGVMNSTTGYCTDPTNFSKITRCYLFNPKGQPIKDYASPMTSQDWHDVILTAYPASN